jgi:mannose-6-phosphate isomerase-like protein (cupin superfamily)
VKSIHFAENRTASLPVRQSNAAGIAPSRRTAGQPEGTCFAPPSVKHLQLRGETVQHKHLQFGQGFRVVLGDEHSQAAQMTLEPSESEGGPDNRHRGADQWLYVVSGAGAAIVNGERVELREGTLLFIRHGDRHEIRNTGDGPPKTLNVYVPPAYTDEGEELSAGRA